jgi:hypothetical protein
MSLIETYEMQNGLNLNEDRINEEERINEDRINEEQRINEERIIDKLPTIYRFKFTEEFMEYLHNFSKIHQYDERKDFKEAWNIWIETN